MKHFSIYFLQKLSLKNSKRFVIFGILLSIFLGLRFIGLDTYFNLAQLKAQSAYLKQLVKSSYTMSVALYIAIYIGIVALSLPFAALCTLAGGFLFGAFWGAVYACIAATLGATIVFLIVRYVVGTSIQQAYAKRLIAINHNIAQHGISYLLFMRFLAVIPFFVVNIVVALTRVPVITFIWTTAVGIFPGALVFSFAGTQLATLNSFTDIFSWPIMLAFLLLALFALMPVLVGRLGLKR